MPKEPMNIVVIGCSAGGLNALRELVSQFRPDWDAAYFVVLHLSRRGIADFLVHRIRQYSELPCTVAKNEQPIESGTIYVAVPDFHLLVKREKLLLGRGPEENRWRPSIDVLFRSAAVAYDGRVTGIVLTGLLDDGTSGMWAIRRSGGTTIVQDPNEAEYPDMPLSVLNRMEVDHCLRIAEMGGVLDGVMRAPKASGIEVPSDIIAEAELAERAATGIEQLGQFQASHSVYSCPDCGGILFSVENGKINRYRCHTGHSYSEADLETRQAENLEATLWVALRMMEERKNLLLKMEAQTLERGFHRFAQDHRRKVEEIDKHILQLKQLLFGSQDNKEEAFRNEMR